MTPHNMEPSPLPLDSSFQDKDASLASSSSSSHPPSPGLRPLHSPCPSRPPVQPRLPQGQCQAILVGRGLAAGHRCPCTHFTLSSLSPVVVCDCGHMSCYHAVEQYSVDKNELRRLQEQVRMLDEQLRRDHQSSSVDLLSRLSLLEEHVERNYEDLDQRLKESNGRFGCVWQQVDTMEKRGKEIMHTLPVHSHKIRALEAKLDTTYLEMLNSNHNLEGRVIQLEENKALSPGSNPSASATQSPSLQCSLVSQQGPPHQYQHHQQFQSHHPQSLQSYSAPSPVPSRSSRPTSTILPAIEAPSRDDSNPPRQTLQPVSVKFPATSSLSESWTVHVSLLPNRFQPFPFEKDTRAYKRCLSRGLHRCVVVADHNAAAFNQAIIDAFGPLLCGRPWMPLQAKLCDVHDLQGLPMLRQLDPSYQNMPYDLGFLRTHCAVLCPGGKLDSLYIAMKNDTLSWDFLRQCNVFMPGLDSSWEPDQYLDNESGTVGDLGLGPPLKKRMASEISQVSTGAAAMPIVPPPTSQITLDDAFSRAKIPRTTAVLTKVSGPPRVVETI
ncbi:hypothetical protein BROUX41_003659 [Berkeleyomyces rouxiae]|uniref:uncharacterized protein n=1 Tax=Berkeleyomyces rouxiae TaxID=2035830 RepID=UPI003B7F1AEC